MEVGTAHILYVYKDKLYSSYKNWEFNRIELVLTRLGATYWEIGYSTEFLLKNFKK